MRENPYDFLSENDDHPNENDDLIHPEIGETDLPCAEKNNTMINTGIPL